MQSIIEKLKNMDKKIISIVNIGLKVAFLISLLGIVILGVHYKVYVSAELYYIGIEIFKLGIITAISFIICSCGLWIVKDKFFK